MFLLGYHWLGGFLWEVSRVLEAPSFALPASCWFVQWGSNTVCYLATSDFAVCVSVQNTFFPVSYDVACYHEFSDILALHYICDNSSMPPMETNLKLLSIGGKVLFALIYLPLCPIWFQKELLRLLEETTRVGKGLVSLAQLSWRVCITNNYVFVQSYFRDKANVLFLPRH